MQIISSSQSKLLKAIVFVCCISVLGGLSAQQPKSEALRQIQVLQDEKASRTPAQKKIDSHILLALKLQTNAEFKRSLPELKEDLVKVVNGMVKVDIDATVTPQLLAAIRNLGGEVIFSSERFRSITANIPLLSMEKLAAVAEVKFINLWIAPKHSDGGSAGNKDNNNKTATGNKKATAEQGSGFARRAGNIRKQFNTAFGWDDHDFSANSGAVSSEADVTHKADIARSTFGTTGAGIKIGVLSDGVTGYATSQASGDLPAVIHILPGQAGSGSEGRAMMELIHDIAPDADLYFATAFTSQASFAQNILDLRTAGCDIIVDDVIYLAEGVFQDDNISQAVNSVTASGALYFSSAGNDGNKNDGTAGAWEGDFVDGGTNALFPGGTVNDFGGGTLYNTITTNSGLILLKWSDPLGQSGNDYDLFVLNSGGTAVEYSSTKIQDGNDMPFEICNAADSRQVYILKKTGAAVRALHLNTVGGELSVSTSGTVFGHNGAASAYSVAATPAAASSYGSTGPFPGTFNSSNKVENFSSDGLRKMFFNPDGSAITPGNVLFGTNGGVLLQKPDIAAADGVSTNTPGFQPFFGTSAAAPNAAAIAGLIKSKFPAATPAQIHAALIGSAIDIETPGVDRDAGAGIVMAYEAIQQFMIDQNCPTITITNPAVSSEPVNTFFSQTFTQSGAVGDVIFSTASTLPSGVTLSGDGVLSGTPMQYGTYPVTVLASQSNGCSGTSSLYNLVITGFDIRASSPVTITAENATPANNAPDPDETLTVDLPLINVGNANTSDNIFATLQATGGVTSPSGIQKYGTIEAGGTVNRPFTFKANGNCGGFITLTLALQDVNTPIGTVSYTLKFGTTGTTPGSPQTFSNTAPITIPATGTGASTGAPASPYPSNITVSGLPGKIASLTVSINQFTHTYAKDVDVLLVSPTGQKMVILSDIGGTGVSTTAPVNNANLVLDDAASGLLPSSTQVVSGTFKPTNYGTGDVFPSPAPAAPYQNAATAGSATLNGTFGGQSPNGVWSLYVVDDESGDVGSFNGGWSLNIATLTPVCSEVPPGPTASVLSLSGNSEICNGGSANLKVNITGGTSPYTIVYSDGTNQFTVNSYTSGADISVSPSTTTTYSLVSVTDAVLIAGTGNSGTPTITVNQPTTWYADTDGDGYGDNNTTVQACDQPTGYISTGGDCNDSDPAIHPGATEICDGIDNNCDGQVDEGFPLVNYYRDADGDGYGNPNDIFAAKCSAPAGYISTSGDCDDSNAAIHPGAIDVCDFIDNDCDGQIDEDGPLVTYYFDVDGDGYGDPNNPVQARCYAPQNTVTNNGDCNDHNAAIHPGAAEICGNGIDDNCNGQIDEGSASITYYKDADGDGYGNPKIKKTANCTPPAGYVANNGDCNDNNAAVHPGATEICDGIDNNCDGKIDEGFPFHTYYLDADGDGYGNPKMAKSGKCNPPAGYVSNNKDCNDNNAAVHPGATEVCDGIDNNCDGKIDEGFPFHTYYRDADGDGYGNPKMAKSGKCNPPAGYVSNNKDCNDNNAAVHPGATEICDGIDNNCDGKIDEGFPYLTYYRDADGDGYGDPKMAKSGKCTIPAGYVSNNKDCNDNNAAVHPGATEICGNGIDDNCNGKTDEGCNTVNGNNPIVSLARPAAAEANRIVKLFPNPAQSKVLVSMTGYTGRVIIQLQSMDGKTLRQEQVNAGSLKAAQQPLDIARFTNGMYLVLVTDEKGNRETKKLVIVH